MLGFLKRLFAPGSTAAPDSLSAQSELKSQRMELEARDKTIARLKADLERERSTARSQADEIVRARVQRLLQNVAGPAAQLALQGYLLEAEGKPVAARDVLAVARNLVRALENEGLTVEQQPGQRVTFDPNRHEPLSVETPLSSGQPALVKLPGLSFQGALLRKAGVIPAS